MKENYGEMFDEAIEASGKDADVFDIAKNLMDEQWKSFELEFEKTAIKTAFSSYETMKDFVGIGYLRQLLAAENHLPEEISDEELAVCAEKMKTDEGYIDEYLTLLKKSAN